HAVPTDHVEGVMGKSVATQTPAVLDEYCRVFFAVDDLRLTGAVEVTFAVGRSEADLAVGLEVSLRNDHASRRFKNKQIGLGAVNAGIEFQAISGAAGHDDVVASLKREHAENAVQHAGPLMDKENLIGRGIAIQLGLRLGWT